MTEEEKRERTLEMEREKKSEITVLKASAGSGKTYNLAYRYIRKILPNPALFHEILAVTFTNKATCQMKDKILESLNELKKSPDKSDYIDKLLFDIRSSNKDYISQKASSAQMEILSDYDRFSVSTIDKFFSKVVRGFFHELEKDPSYAVVTSTSELIDKAIIDVISDKENSELLEPLFQQRTSENGKNYDIKQDIKTIKDAILKLHGQTFNITPLRKQLNEDSEKVEAKIKEVSEIAQNAISKLLPDGESSIDIYSYGRTGFMGGVIKIASGTLNDENKFDPGKRFYGIIEEDGNPFPKKSPYWTDSERIEDIKVCLSQISKKVNEYNDNFSHLKNTVEIIEKKVNMLEIIKVIYDKFISNCKEENIVTISQMPALVGEIARNTDLSYLYMKIGILLKTIMIDEFQDTSKEQWEGFKPILEEICSSVEDSDNLIIGDLKQAIYRWRGGDEKLLRENVGKDFGIYEKPLGANYRSLKEIIDFNNHLYSFIAENGISNSNIDFAGKADIVVQTNDYIKQTYETANQQLGNPKKQSGGYVQCLPCDKDQITSTVIDKIKEVTQNGFLYQDIAIIARYNFDAVKIANALAEAEIPFISAESLLLNNSPFVRKMVALMHIAINPEDELSTILYYSLSSPLTKDSAEKLTKASSMKPTDAVEYIGNLFSLTPSEPFKNEVLAYSTVSEFISAFIDKESYPIDDRKIAVLMKIATNKNDNIAKDKFCYLNLKTKIAQEKLELLTSAATMSLIEAVVSIQETMELFPTNDDTAFCDSFMNIIFSKYKEKAFSVADFVTWWDDTGKDSMLSSPEGQNAVCIITIHKSKGLEYPVVIAPYLNWDFTPKNNSTLLLSADIGTQYEQFGTLPLDYSEKKLYNSCFKNAYLSEIKQSIIDNLNLLYVTTTRAKERLYLLYPDKANNHSVANFIINFLSAEKQSDNDTYSFHLEKGKLEQKKIETKIETKKTNEIVHINDISSSKFEGKLIQASVFSMDKDNPRTIRKYQGVLMHNALSKISSLDELRPMVERLSEIEGISKEQFDQIIDKILQNNEIKEWFNPKWKIYNERGIIIPGQSSGRRPDRVITDEESAIVIDYKFGDKESDKYTQQVTEYMSLLKQMGYVNILGYIYYINLDKIISCSLD